ncbi:MAG: permease prefix domain 1-containing protein [Oscillospiraceae bacterium]|nr:permease prefix domain 1-containing protein [Oscillospiraceae bacterium]
MQDKLRRYVDNLFASTTPTRKSVELKEEMIQNLSDKYNDLLSEGKTDEAAYNIAVAGIGDVSDLLKELETDESSPVYVQDIEEMEKARRKSAMLTAIAIMMYIVSFVPVMILSMVDSPFQDVMGVPLMFIIIAAATGLLIYNNMTKPKYRKQRDTMVEEFREWQSDEKDRKQLRKAISSALWSIVLAAYFIISFTTFAWHITWIIFIIGAVVESLLNVIFALKKK